MKLSKFVALALLTVGAAGCSSVHPLSLSSPFGDSERDRQELNERYAVNGEGSDTLISSGPAAAAPPAESARSSRRAPTRVHRSGWWLSSREREAEAKSITRDMPHAVVTPWSSVVAN